MPKKLVTFRQSKPAMFGLNRQDSGDILPDGWATEAKNCVFDKLGRLSSRKGTTHVNATAVSGTPTIRAVHEYIDSAGNTLIIAAAGNAIYKVSGTTLTDITGSATTPTADNWKFINFNSKCIGVQDGHAPIVLSAVAGTFADITYTAQAPTAANEALSAFGRVWYLDGNNLEYSDLLDETNGGAGYGLFDLSTVWPEGMDEGVGLAEFNGHLIVLGKRSIIIYSNPWTPTGTGSSDVTTMSLVESLSGVGCIARDSIQFTGDDIVFLSGNGIVSLGRVIQEKSMPTRKVSKNINDFLVDKVANENKDNIKSTYSKNDDFYLISLPSQNLSYYFDLRGMLEDGSFRCTEWTLVPTALLSTVTNTVYMGSTGGWLNEYDGYKDNILSNGSSGDNYLMLYHSPWSEVTPEIADYTKIAKRISAHLSGSVGQTVTIKWAFDYAEKFYADDVTLPEGTISRFGVGKYGIDKYSGKTAFTVLNTHARDAGRVLKLGFQATVKGQQVSLQRFDLQFTLGRLTV